MANAPVPLQTEVASRSAAFTAPVPLRVAVGTYNINSGKYFRTPNYEGLTVADWLDCYKEQKTPALLDLDFAPSDAKKEEKRIDVYALGFEEIVDLDAKNIVLASSENARAWAEDLSKILDRGGEDRFTLLAYQQLVGVCLFLFVRPEHAARIAEVSVDTVKTGLGGAAGNKGSVAIRFNYLSTSLAFVCSHFAAHQNNISDRNADFEEAAKKLRSVSASSFYTTG